MEKPSWLENQKFHPIIKLPKSYYVHDFSKGPDLNPTDIPYSVGRYNEKRIGMYTTDLFIKEERNIHMGVDIAAPVDEAIYSFAEGEVYLKGHDKEEGGYGPTVITKHSFEGNELYALYGHLSEESLNRLSPGEKLNQGDVIGFIGAEEVNGGWFPHVHFQISLEAPREPNMPGVVSELQHLKALEIYPDPQWVLGKLYK